MIKTDNRYGFNETYQTITRKSAFAGRSTGTSRIMYYGTEATINIASPKKNYGNYLFIQTKNLLIEPRSASSQDGTIINYDIDFSYSIDGGTIYNDFARVTKIMPNNISSEYVKDNSFILDIRQLSDSDRLIIKISKERDKNFSCSFHLRFFGLPTWEEGE